jgi:hypothetical protein
MAGRSPRHLSGGERPLEEGFEDRDVAGGCQEATDLIIAPARPSL